MFHLRFFIWIIVLLWDVNDRWKLNSNPVRFCEIITFQWIWWISIEQYSCAEISESKKRLYLHSMSWSILDLSIFSMDERHTIELFDISSIWFVSSRYQTLLLSLLNKIRRSSKENELLWTLYSSQAKRNTCACRARVSLVLIVVYFFSLFIPRTFHQ